MCHKDSVRDVEIILTLTARSCLTLVLEELDEPLFMLRINKGFVMPYQA